MLTIYKASAGSGKTFQLVAAYLKLLMQNPFNYRHILAVTFTNKATNEMKSRILEQLAILANNKPSKYILVLQEGTSLSEDELRTKARIVIKNILHDYSRFTVSTIDAFTQRIIKSFNHDLGISAQYELELDNELVLAEAADRLLANIHNNKTLLKWLSDFSREKIEMSRSQRIENDIQTLGKELFKEKFQLFFTEDNNQIYSLENLNEFISELVKIRNWYESSVKELAGKLVIHIEAAGLGIDDFFHGKNGIAGYIYAIAKGEMKDPGIRILNAEADAAHWYKKDSRNAKFIHQLADEQLIPQLKQLLSFQKENSINYYTTIAVQGQIRILGILTDLKEEIRTLMNEKGMLQISDSNLLLSKIIGNSDSPFIYEKTGSYLRYLMLDEFQDTSGLQWHNFKPLIINSLAEGNQNLVVGDVKQSIYRWRNSDWNILAEKIYNDFHIEQITDRTLNQNWRSRKNIINFNNHVFESLKTVFEEVEFGTLEGDNKKYIDRFRNIYQSVSQVAGKTDTEESGYIDIHFFEKETYSELTIPEMIMKVKELQDRGIKASETAILIRRAKDGIPVINGFMEASANPDNKDYNLSVLSNESLFLFSSQAVSFVMNVLELIKSPDNEIIKVALLNQYITWLKPELIKRKIIAENKSVQPLSPDHKLKFEKELSLKLNDVREKLMHTSPDEAITQVCNSFHLFEIEAELPFIQTLIDKAGELKSKLSNDISNFLFWWNENGYKQSVTVNEDVDSIRLLTIHKAKGLEFKAVLIPFFNWNATPPYLPVIWCNTTEKPFNRFPLLPVKSGSLLMKTWFKDDYLEETSNYFIDVFNLIYVAFTRAITVLIVHAPVPVVPKKDSNTSKPVEYTLYRTLENIAENESFTSSWDEDRKRFRYGCIPYFEKEEKKQDQGKTKKYHFYDFSTRISLKNAEKRYADDDTADTSLRQKGNIIHEILSSVKSAGEIEEACKKALFEGKISESEQIEVLQNIEANFSNQLIKSWFDGSYEVLTERNLLTPEYIYRPDRIMIRGIEAVVIDYKTGLQKRTKYNRQVQAYAGLLKS